MHVWAEETDFGQSRSGHPDLTNFGPSNFGQSNFLANIFGVMVGPQRVGGRRVGERTVGAQNFALNFHSPATVFVFLSLSFGLFRGILVVFEAPGRSKCARLEFSGCRVRAPNWPKSVWPKSVKTLKH